MSSRPESARARREARHHQMLDAACAVFAEKGYHGAGVSDVIERAGVARGTFYLYFESKRAVFDALVDGFMADVASRIRRVDVSPGAPSPWDQIHANLVRILELASARPDLLRILLWESAGVDAQSEEKMTTFHLGIFGLIQRSLDTGVSLGIVRACDTEVVARCLMGALKEVLLSMLVRKDLTGRDIDTIAREMLGFSLHGLMAGPTG